ncbi:hypothetical protein [Pseudomonas costantinii]|uniref:Uncharacterized protein n=1 Tax=Pseudomonas costantinii TaxID=168469 RepID=A0A1S2UUV0_9PSED|nr:hypothetical protein [Pseudomonas costantinii]NVZ22984.1 hypothetical protein [Pseudomonas costantinii]OIN49688.1 hypothetical protein BFL40_23365 [Pseudomonas costantinii]SEE23631.1 hypothetical protein SAMN04515675_4562 [Pseudomonas costantinii]
MANYPRHTTGTFEAQSNQISILSPTNVSATYANGTLSLSATDSDQSSLIMALRIDLASDVQSGTYVWGTHSIFKGVNVTISEFPVLYDIMKAFVRIDVNHQTKMYSGELQYTGVATFGPKIFIDISAQFALSGALTFP